jgi:hypothetical protein
LKLKKSLNSDAPSKFKCLQVLCYLFKSEGHLNRQENYYLRMKNSLKEKLDIFTVVSVSEEIKKIKQILFDNQQKNIIEYIRDDFERDKEETIDILLDSYNFCENRGSPIDKNIIKLFNEQYLS